MCCRPRSRVETPSFKRLVGTSTLRYLWCLNSIGLVSSIPDVHKIIKLSIKKVETRLLARPGLVEVIQQTLAVEYTRVLPSTYCQVRLWWWREIENLAHQITFTYDY